MSNNDSKIVAAEHKANELPDGFDWLGIAKHFAKHTALELAKLQDAIQQVKRDEITQGYKSGIVSLDALGNGKIDLKETTKTLILQKQGGYLDSTTMQIGDFKFTYPASKEITIDTINLPTFSPQLILSGNAGDNYIVTQSVKGIQTFSDVMRGFTVTSNVQVTNTPNVQLSGSNAASGDVVSITTADTAQQLPSVACNEVTLIGLKGNTGTVYVGFTNGVTNTSYAVALDPKDSFTFKITNSDMLYIYGAAGDGVSYVAL